MLDDPLLDLLEVVVVLVEDLAGRLEVEIVVGRLVPGEREDPLEVGADDPVLGGRGRELRKPVELAPRLLVGVLGKLRLLDLCAQLGELRLLLVRLAELLLDRLQLLAQEVLPLGLVHLLLHLGLDLRSQLEDLQLAREDHGQLPQTLLDVDRLEEVLLLLRLQADGRGDQVGELARALGVRSCQQQFLGEVRRDRDDAAEERLHGACERLRLLLALDHVGQRREEAGEVGLGLLDRVEPDAVEALDEDAEGPVGDPDHLVHHGRGPDLVQVLGAVRLLLRVAGGDEGDGQVVGDRLVDQADRALLADREGRHRRGKDDAFAQGEDGQRGRALDLALRRPLLDGAHSVSPPVTGTRTGPGWRRFSGRAIVSRPFW